MGNQTGQAFLPGTDLPFLNVRAAHLTAGESCGEAAAARIPDVSPVSE